MYATFFNRHATKKKTEIPKLVVIVPELSKNLHVNEGQYFLLEPRLETFTKWDQQ